MVDSFIGSRFGVDGHLEVIGTCERVKGKEIKYKVVCSVCEQEHVGEIYTSFKSSLVRGSLPCYCRRHGGGERLTEEQQTMKIVDECAVRSFEFLGYVGEYGGVSTKLKLLRLKDGHEWHTCNISNFFRGRGCPKGAKTIPDDETVNKFMATGSFKEGTKFWRLPTEDKPHQWAYHCTVCSVDEHVMQGLCSGVFTAHRSSLMRGVLSCRCCKKYSWTQEQRECQISKIIRDENLPYKLLGWKGVWNGAQTAIHLYCESHGVDFFPKVSTFVNTGTRCPSCAVGGFDPNNDAFVYVLRVEGLSGAFTGYGITCDTRARLRDHRRNLSREGFSITEYQVLPMIGSEALGVEKAIKENFTLCPQNVEAFRSEATHACLYSDVVEFVRQQAVLQL